MQKKWPLFGFPFYHKHLQLSALTGPHCGWIGSYEWNDIDTHKHTQETTKKTNDNFHRIISFWIVVKHKEKFQSSKVLINSRFVWTSQKKTEQTLQRNCLLFLLVWKKKNNNGKRKIDSKNWVRLEANQVNTV